MTTWRGSSFSAIAYFLLWSPRYLGLSCHSFGCNWYGACTKVVPSLWVTCWDTKLMNLSLSKDYWCALKVALLLQIAIGVLAIAPPLKGIRVPLALVLLRIRTTRRKP